MESLSHILDNYSAMVVLVMIVAVLALIIWNTVLQIAVKRLKEKNKTIFSGGNIKNLEDVIVQHSHSIKSLDKEIQELYSISNQINGLAYRGLHKVALVRFNPFNDVGGDQSFSLVLLNGKNNGIVVSSLFTRDGARIYSKSIVGGKSEKYPLTEEEEQVIKTAIGNETKKIN